jgi:hypothetical protein
VSATPDASPSPDERARVRVLLGREPQGAYTIAARGPDGDPRVLRNAPFLDDGTPMPTLYWLIGPDDVRRVGRLEAAGGVDAAEREVDPDALAAAHARYAAERDASIAPDHTGPRPSGGVGGTRAGVKCLHAHWAWHLAGGDDPVGRWIESRLTESTDGGAAAEVAVAPAETEVRIEVGDEETLIRLPSGVHTRLPWGTVNLSRRWLDDEDPPHASSLTNALGTVDDHLDDVEREHAAAAEAIRAGVSFAGPAIAALARLELGRDDPPERMAISRHDAEDVFRLVATETSHDRAHNPGLPSQHVGTIVATCCVVLSVMRRFHLDEVALLTGPDTGRG